MTARGGVAVVAGASILVLLACVAGLPGLGDRDFWPQDEARYGTVALEMWKGAHPAVPHLNGEVYQDKPPLYFWLVNLAAFARGGVDEGAARAPSVFGAALLALGAYAMLVRAAGVGCGVLAGLLVLGTWLVSWEFRQAHLDVLFGGFIALGMAAFSTALEPGRERWSVAGFLMIGLAVLVKGPLAFLPVATFAIAAVMLRRPGALFNRWFVPGILVAVLPSVLWLGWAYLHLNGVKAGAGDEYVRALFVDQVAGRVAVARAHLQPWHYYLVQLPYGLSPFLPIGLLALSGGVRRAAAPLRAPFVVAAVWLVVAFVAQSAFPGKRLLYMTPLVAPFAVIAAVVVHTGTRGALAFATGWAALVGCVVFIGSGALVTLGLDDWSFTRARTFAEDRIGARLLDHEEDHAESRPLDPEAAGRVVKERLATLDWTALRRGGLVAGILGLVTAAIALTALALGAARAGVSWTAASFALTVGLALGFLLPVFDPLVSRRDLVLAAVRAAGGPDAPIGFLRHFDEAFPYYAGRPVQQLFGSQPPKTDEERRAFKEAATTFLRKKGSVLVVRRDDFEEQALSSLAPGRIHGPIRTGGKQYYLFEGVR